MRRYPENHPDLSRYGLLEEDESFTFFSRNSGSVYEWIEADSEDVLDLADDLQIQYKEKFDKK